ncbi:hypothetical protein QFC20_006501 [Naganishia adeliensis]|uniref:Uncharacterized protein n=1 Tax=Naganishia adeliensis TaxID=92952 RepID=A0ACC2VAL8_9TREE|nr:hypothetical protein QFC20_006501 [Naganishia adeliensis]
MSEASVNACQSNNDDSHFGLRIAAIFIILVTSLIGALAPVVLHQTNVLPTYVFEQVLCLLFAKFFGSGVIISTAFIHLLAPAFEQLGSECLPESWRNYPWAPAIAMFAVYVIFFFEVAANRIGTRRLGRAGLLSHKDVECRADLKSDLNMTGDTATNPPESSRHVYSDAMSTTLDCAAIPGANDTACCKSGECDTDDTYTDPSLDISYDPYTSEGIAQIVAIAILEFGVLLHSVIIGLTLGVSDNFVTLFIALVFHQMFEGLGLGSRLSALRLPSGMWWVPYVAGLLYALMTPIGVAAGVGARAHYNGQAASMLAVAGVLDAFSAGIMLYSGLVTLLGHEIILSPKMMNVSIGRMAYAFGCMLAGSGIMALIAYWFYMPWTVFELFVKEYFALVEMNPHMLYNRISFMFDEQVPQQSLSVMTQALAAFYDKFTDKINLLAELAAGCAAACALEARLPIRDASLSRRSGLKYEAGRIGRIPLGRWFES